MDTRQIVFDEANGYDIELLTDGGVAELFRCFLTDIGQYKDMTHPLNRTTQPSWDATEASNWDYFLCGLQDLFDYTEFMSSLAKEVGDDDAEFAYSCAIAMLDELQQTFGEVLDYTNGDSDEITYDCNSHKFWQDIYFNIMFAEQATNQIEISREVSQ